MSPKALIRAYEVGEKKQEPYRRGQYIFSMMGGVPFHHLTNKK